MLKVAAAGATHGNRLIPALEVLRAIARLIQHRAAAARGPTDRRSTGLAVSKPNPERAAGGFGEQLSRKPHDVVDETWAGGVPAQYGVAPRVRVGRDRWLNLLWLVPLGFVVLLAAVAVAKGLRETAWVADFLNEHPGTVLPAGAEEGAGFPPWVGWQHFLNMLLLIPIIRSGVTIIADHPRLYWTRHSTPGKDWFRVQKPVPTDPLYTAKEDSITLPDSIGLPGRRHSIGLARWWHLGMDTLWLANGIVFYLTGARTPAPRGVWVNRLTVSMLEATDGPAVGGTRQGVLGPQKALDASVMVTAQVPTRNALLEAGGACRFAGGRETGQQVHVVVFTVGSRRPGIEPHTCPFHAPVVWARRCLVGDVATLTG